MKRVKPEIILALSFVLVAAVIWVYDYKKPACVEAQTCTSSVEPGQAWRGWYTGSGGVGCHHFCAICGAWGMDDNGDEGFSVNPGGGCGGGKISWSIQVGVDQDRRAVCCFNLN